MSKEFDRPSLRKTHLLALATLGIIPTAHASDLTTVQSRIQSQLISSAPSDSTIQSYMTSESSNGSWSYVDYNNTSQTDWLPATALTQMQDMAEAYWNTSSSLYQNSTLQTDILNAYNYWISVNPQSTNWYDNDIRTPQGISSTVLLMQPDMSSTQLSEADTIMNNARGELSVPSIAQGSNLVLLATVGINQGIIDNSTSDISQGFNEIQSTVFVDNAEAGDGIQPDNSYHFHGNQLYEGDYGVTALQDPLQYASISAGTSYAFSTADEQILVNTLLGSQWFVYGQSLDFSASGRDASRQGFDTDGTAYISAIQYALSLGSYQSTALTAFLNRQQSAQSTGKANSSLGLTGNVDFYDSDAMVQQRPNYFESVKVTSTRTINPESINGENLKGLYLGDGVNEILVTGNQFNNIEPVWNWYRLPGTTVEQNGRSLQPGSADSGATSFAGGVSDGTFGAEALDYNRFNVSALKSWYFFNNEEVALGAAINAPNATSEVDTTLNQCLLTSNVTYETTTGGIQTLTTGTVSPTGLKWVYQGGVGYFFPTPVNNAVISAGTQTGNWQAINSQYSNATVTESVFTLYMNEGSATSNQSYSYIVVPNTTESAMDSYLASDPIQMLANNSTVQAIRQSTLGNTQATFYSPGSITIAAGQTLSVNNPSMVMLQQQTNTLKLAASSPQNLGMAVQIQLSGVSLSGATWLNSLGTATAIFNLPSGNNAGESIGLTLGSDGATNPTVSLANTTGSAPLSYTVTGPVPLASNTTFQTDSNSTLIFANAITGNASVTTSGSITFAAPNGYSGGTTVTSGKLLIATTGALPDDPTKITAGTLQLAPSTGAATISSLAISGTGTFDITNNHVLINYGANPDPIASIAALLTTDFNAGNWNGPGGIISSAITPGYSLGYADSADPGNPAGLSSGTIEIKYTLLGDANLDGIVNGTDFGILAANFNKGVSAWDAGDFFYHGVVNGQDFGALAANFNKGATGASVGPPADDDPAILQFAAANGLLADVPEPASITLAVPALAILLRRRRLPLLPPPPVFGGRVGVSGLPLLPRPPVIPGRAGGGGSKRLTLRTQTNLDAKTPLRLSTPDTYNPNPMTRALLIPLLLFTTNVIAADLAPSICLTDAQCARLSALVRDDPEAAAQFASIKTSADRTLTATPDPIPAILSEGLLASDPKRIRTWHSLDDMYRLQSLSYSFAVTHDHRYADKIRQYLLAWSSINHSAGDPIDDTNLEPLIISFDLTARDLSPAARTRIIAYLHQVADAEIKTGQGPAHTNVNNWNSHRIKIIGLIAFALRDKALIDHTISAFHTQIEKNLLPDGSSIDFHERDALHYHEYDIHPLVTLAIAARNNGLDFYNYHSPTGSSLSTSVAFIIPYADGSKIHPEFVNSTAPFDRKRAAAGEGDYKAGNIWDPHNALDLLAEAQQFDPTLIPIVRRLADSQAKRFPKWQIVVNAARNP